MDAVRPLRFQPTVVVCVGPPGRAVRDELALLLPSIDTHRRAGIAFLRVEGERLNTSTGDPDAEPPLLGSRDEPDIDYTLDSTQFSGPNGANDANPRGRGRAQPQLLTTLVVEALRGRNPPQGLALGRAHAADTDAPLGVLDDKVIQRIKDEGYSVPSAQVVVWIVASPQTPWLEPVACDVQRALASEGVSGKVLLALSNFYEPAIERRAEQEQACRDQPWDTLLGTGDNSPELRNGPLADFGYLFEVRDEQGLYWNEQDIAFAIAEVIFILTTTAILSTPELDNVLHSSLPHLLASPIERMGGAGASRLTFPRAHIEHYCASRMAAAIVGDWVPREAQSSPPALLALVNEQDRAARRWVARVDGSPRSETASTNAVIEALRAKNLNRDAGSRLPSNKPDEARIFHYFSQNELGQLEGQGERDLESILKTQRAMADQGLRLWRSAIKAYWRDYERAMLAELSAMTKNDVLMGAGGVERARLFFEGLDKAIGTAKEKMALAREQRETRYAAFLDDFAERGSNGPWAALLPERSIETDNRGQGAMPTQPAGQRIDPAVRFVGHDDQQAADQAQGQGDVPVEPVSREDQIILQLAARHRWYTKMRPTPPGVTPVAVTSTPPMVLLEVAVVSATIPLLVTPITVVLLTVLNFLLLQVGARSLLPKHLEHETARDDLINFHRGMFRYQTRQIEDDRREFLIIGLHAEIRNSLERLEHWDAFVAELGKILGREANSAETRLFDGSIGRRDIFVANQQPLTRDGYGLAALERDVARRREERPKPGKEWHAHTGDIVRHMRDAMPEHVSLLKSTEEQIVQPIFAFCRSIVREYLDGPIADIGQALRALPSADQSGLLTTLVQRSLIMYRPDTSSRRTPLIFICTRDENRMYLVESALTRDAIVVRIQDQDWLGTIRITHGGGEPSFWASATNSPPNLPAAPTWGLAP